MSRNEREELDVYVIPPNFIEGGKLFGGMFKMRNAIEAGILAGGCALLVFKLLLSLTGKIIVLCLTSLPLAIFGLLGVDGESLSQYIVSVIKFLRNRRRLYRSDVDDFESVGKVRLKIKKNKFLNAMEVCLVVYDKKAFQISEKLFNDVQCFIDEKLVKTDERRRIIEDGAIRESHNLCASQRAMSDECVEKYQSAKPMMPSEAVVGSMASIKEKKSLEDLMNMKVETFSEMLLRMIDERGMTDVEVYKRANIDRKLFSKIRKKDYTPKKVTVVALIIALKLNMKEARELLGRAGFAFTQSSKFDIIIEYFIEQGKYDIFEINETLFAFEQQLLGA